jgi:hypothetical protein
VMMMDDTYLWVGPWGPWGHVTSILHRNFIQDSRKLLRLSEKKDLGRKLNRIAHNIGSVTSNALPSAYDQL